MPQSKLEQIALARFLRQPEGAAQKCDPSCAIGCRCDMAAVSLTSTRNSKQEQKDGSIIVDGRPPRSALRVRLVSAAKMRDCGAAEA